MIMVVLPLFLHHLGSNPSTLGIATSLSAFAAMSTRPVAGLIADKKSRKLAMNIGLPVMAVGMLGLSALPFAAAIIIIRFAQGSGISLATTAQMVRNPLFFLLPSILCFGGSLFVLYFANGMGLILAAAILYGIGLGISTASISAIAMSSATPERRGAASATFQCAVDIGYCLGSFLWGMVAGLLGYRSLYGILALIPVLTFILSIVLFGGSQKARRNIHILEKDISA